MATALDEDMQKTIDEWSRKYDKEYEEYLRQEQTAKNINKQVNIIIFHFTNR